MVRSNDKDAKENSRTYVKANAWPVISLYDSWINLMKKQQKLRNIAILEKTKR